MRIRGLGFAEDATEVLARHFLDADARGRTGHGLTRLDWLSTLPGLRPEAEPKRLLAEPGYERWEGNGALGYLTLDAIVRSQLETLPERARVIVASHCFPTGVLGYWTRRLAEAGLVAALAATSPARLASPGGGAPL